MSKPRRPLSGPGSENPGGRKEEQDHIEKFPLVRELITDGKDSGSVGCDGPIIPKIAHEEKTRDTKETRLSS